MDWGTVGEWVSGMGALAAAGVALWVARDAKEIARRDRESAERSAAESRAAMARDRTVARLVDLVRVAEADLHQFEQFGRLQPSPEGTALCRSLWSYRNLIGTTWDLYCAPHATHDRRHISNLISKGELGTRVRKELQSAIDSMDSVDRL